MTVIYIYLWSSLNLRLDFKKNIICLTMYLQLKKLKMHLNFGAFPTLME